MIKAFVDRILDLAKPELIAIDAVQYSSKPLHRVTPPRAAALSVHTLTGLADYITEELDPLDFVGSFALHIVDACQVSLIASYDETYRDRECFMTAIPITEERPFQFGKFIPAEEFIIGLQSQFVKDESVESVLKVVGNIKDREVRNFGDNGISQSVTAKAGVSLVQEVPLPNPIPLRPYRTFLEVEQPVSTFVLRARSGEEAPLCALFLADGMRWKITAIQSIKAWLKGQLPKMRIIA
jgi:hypothetical protein